MITFADALIEVNAVPIVTFPSVAVADDNNSWIWSDDFADEMAALAEVEDQIESGLLF